MIDPNNFVCPVCAGEFPKFYWGVSGKYGGYGTHKKPGIAKANFLRHLKTCRVKHGWVFCDDCCVWFKDFSAYALHFDEPDNDCREE